MAIYAENLEALAALLPAEVVGTPVPGARPEPELAPLVHAVFDDATSLYTAPVDVTGWRGILIRDHARASQYDLVAELLRQGVAVPDSVACLARSGHGMHGFRGRPWSAHPGNIHLVVHFAPGVAVERFESAFTALAAVSAAEAAESVPGVETAGGARLKWVNDVVVAGCKVGGVLAYTQTRDAVVSSVVLGIGLNVETSPGVERSPEVPAAASLRELVTARAGTATSSRTTSAAEGGAGGIAGATGPGASSAAGVWTGPVVVALLDALRRNYLRLLDDGATPLLDAYRTRSSIIGRHVTVVSDDVARTVIAEGRVTGIGDGLELHIEGVPAPVTRGRIGNVSE